MGLAVLHFVADFHDAGSAFCLCYVVFPFLWRVVREDFSQLLRGDKIDVVRQDFVDIVVLYRHIFFCILQAFINVSYYILECVESSLLTVDDFFPVPLVYKDGVDIVGILVAAYGIHVSVDAFSNREAVFFEGVPLPLGEGLHDLCDASVLLFDVKADRAFHAV